MRLDFKGSLTIPPFIRTLDPLRVVSSLIQTTALKVLSDVPILL